MQVLEGRGVSQALRAVWGEMRSLETVASAVTAFCGKPHPVWHCSVPWAAGGLLPCRKRAALLPVLGPLPLDPGPTLDGLFLG